MAARLVLLLLALSPAASAEDADVRGLFRPDPVYEELPYSAERQREIYGGKTAVRAPRPLLELGRPLYKEGPYPPSGTWLGRLNPTAPHFMAYGDLRAAAAYNDNGKGDTGTAALRLNLDLDLKLTATERIHAFVRPLDRDGQFTRLDLAEGRRPDGVFFSDFTPETLFFEGDLARMAAGFSGRENGLDLPFAAGLFPLVLQNGVWADDAAAGAALTFPARNSAALGVSNMDLTVFALLDRLTTAATPDAAGKPDDEDAKAYGAAAFVEANGGYWEAGYAFVDASAGRAYHNGSAAFTRRWLDRLSGSLRVIVNAGQDGPRAARTADGALLLLESSLVSSKPLTVVPYLNLFAGFGRPQSLARDAGAGGPLRNTGILFETDGLTGFPKLDDTGADAYGGAVGLEHLFALDQQLVLEAAWLNVRAGADASTRPAKGRQAALGFRWQKPLTRAWLVRADGIAASRSGDADLAGLRLELRRKF